MSTLSAPLDFASLTEVVTLSDDDIDRARRLCQSIADPDEQWHSYERSLAFLGVKQWLQTSATPYDLSFDDQRYPDRATALRVNHWRVGIIPVGSLPTRTVLIPQTAAMGESAMMLWFLVEVQEELGQVWIVQALEGRHLAERAITITTTNEYELPLTAFTLAPDRALLYLSYLPEAVRPPAATAIAPAEAVDAVAQSSIQPLSLPSLGMQVMNAGRWLQDQVDEVAQQFAWTLLDPLTPAMALRSPTQELETILAEMAPQGVAIPDRARAAYTEIQVAGLSLRLYALIWSVREAAIPEWSLLVFLGPSPGSDLPAGLTLRIYDTDTVLTEQVFANASEATFLYAQVFGTWEEAFTLAIVPPGGGTPVTLPAFGFQPNL